MGPRAWGPRYGSGMADSVTIGDLARDPGEVARGLSAWQRGDPEDAVLETLKASARTLRDKRYMLWVWAGRSPLGDPVWLLPITPAEAVAFAPKPAARVLAGCLGAAVRELDAIPGLVTLQDWRGRVAAVLPGLEEGLAEDGLAEMAVPSGARLGLLPDDITVAGAPIALAPGAATGTDGISRTARELHRHPVEVVVALAGQRQSVDFDAYSGELVTALRARGSGRRRRRSPSAPRAWPSRTIPAPAAGTPAPCSSGCSAWGRWARATTPSSTTSRGAPPRTTAARPSRWARRSCAPGCSSRSRASASATSR